MSRSEQPIRLLSPTKPGLSAGARAVPQSDPWRENQERSNRLRETGHALARRKLSFQLRLSQGDTWHPRSAQTPRDDNEFSVGLVPVENKTGQLVGTPRLAQKYASPSANRISTEVISEVVHLQRGATINRSHPGSTTALTIVYSVSATKVRLFKPRWNWTLR